MYSGRKLAVKNAVNLSKIVFFCKSILHAKLQYVCNIPAKYLMNILKAIGGVDFTKYTLSPIVNMYSGRKLSELKMLKICQK